MSYSGFAIMTSLGAILSITGTCFLMGPISQVRSMFHKNRWLSSSLYIFFIVMSIVAGMVCQLFIKGSLGLWLQNAPLAIFCVVGEYLAMTWYSLSYIPYAR